MGKTDKSEWSIPWRKNDKVVIVDLEILGVFIEVFVITSEPISVELANRNEEKLRYIEEVIARKNLTIKKFHRVSKTEHIREILLIGLDIPSTVKYENWGDCGAGYDRYELVAFVKDVFDFHPSLTVEFCDENQYCINRNNL